MLKKLLIEAFSDESMDTLAGRYQVQINPEKYSHSLATAFSEDTEGDTYSVVSKLKTQPRQNVSFAFYVDATGGADEPKVDSVSDEIEKFRRVACKYNGNSHSPNYLRLSWGSLEFKCTLASLNMAYELFSPSGMPLRARLSVKFREHLTPKDIVERARKESTDLTGYSGPS